MTTYTQQERMQVAWRTVAAGRKWLQEEGPRYDFLLERVKLDLLNMVDGQFCVLSQAHARPGRPGNYIQALIDIHGRYDDDAEAWAARHGFQASVCAFPDQARASYADLQQVWSAVLEDLEE